MQDGIPATATGGGGGGGGGVVPNDFLVLPPGSGEDKEKPIVLG